MAKLKGPLFSLSAQGALAKLLTFRRRNQETVVGLPTTHGDAKSPAQLGWRTMYEACSALWHTLSDVEQQAWETNARSKHMTGYALWQSQCLRPNPGIYLPLAGGTMQGDINTDGHKVTGLPLPTLDPDAASKAYVDAATGPGLQANIISFTREGDTADGPVSYIGVGFQPKALLLIGMSTSLDNNSLGIATGPGNYHDLAWLLNIHDVGGTDLLLEFYDDDWNGIYAELASLDPDGFTITWTKDIPLVTTIYVHALCLA